MTRNRIGNLLIGALAWLALPAVSVAAPTAARQWNVDKTDQINNETEYAIYNGSRKLGYENRTFGVDLGWVNGGFFFFVRKTPDGRRNRRIGPIPEAENVAIFNTKTQRYLMFYRRGDAKAELEWTNTPAYEWQIEDRLASGGRVYFALRNSAAQKYLVYKVQKYGINLGWLEEQNPGPLSIGVAMTAQQITNGWVHYLGAVGQNQKRNIRLISVQNPSHTATLLFLKKGQSTSYCSDPNATVPLAPRGTMTADQLKTLYGYATPLAPIVFSACITMPEPENSPKLIFINITYKLSVF